MNILDWIIIIWLIMGFLVGARTGVVYWVGTVIGVLVGIYVAGEYYNEIATIFSGFPSSKLLAFILILGGIAALSGLVAYIANRVFKIVSWFPFLKTANRLLGGIVSLIANTLFLSIVLFFLSRIEISDVLTQTIVESRLAAILIAISVAISWILPSELSDLPTILE